MNEHEEQGHRHPKSTAGLWPVVAERFLSAATRQTDMDYDDMLDRAIDETPEVSGTDERLDVPDPSVREEGNVTVVENFQTLCRRLSREPDHLLQFLQREVGTSGHIDESGRARITGSFDVDRLADAVETYIDGYVRCPECGLPDTRLERDDGVELRRCEACGARSPTAGESA